MTAVVVVLTVLGGFVTAAIILTIRNRRHFTQTTQQNPAGMNRAYRPTHRR